MTGEYSLYSSFIFLLLESMSLSIFESWLSVYQATLHPPPSSVPQPCNPRCWCRCWVCSALTFCSSAWKCLGLSGEDSGWVTPATFHDMPGELLKRNRKGPWLTSIHRAAELGPCWARVVSDVSEITPDTRGAVKGITSQPLGDRSTGGVGTEFTVWAPFSRLYSGKILSELLISPSKGRSSHLWNHHMYLIRKRQFPYYYASVHLSTYTPDPKKISKVWIIW